MNPRQQWLLLLLGAPGGSHGVDQVRAMKGLFLLAMEPGHPAASLFTFEAYDYGPFDSSVYRDLDAFEAEGLVTVTRFPSTRRRVFDLTDRGRVRYRELTETMAEADLETVARVKARVTSLSFTELLREIYTSFPEFRERSVALEARAGD